MDVNFCFNLIIVRIPLMAVNFETHNSKRDRHSVITLLRMLTFLLSV
jgi:hypothetical protein